jgi:pilus assembly protein Flp/PilA
MNAKSILRRMLRDRSGATAIEYGLILAMLVIAIVSAVRGVADENTGMWAVVSSKAAVAHAGGN